MAWGGPKGTAAAWGSARNVLQNSSEAKQGGITVAKCLMQ